MKTMIAFLATLVFFFNLGPQVAMAGSSNDQKTPALAIDCSEGQADLDETGDVGFSDLTLLLGSWNQSDFDLDGDGVVGFSDLDALLACWGEVPPDVDEPTNSGELIFPGRLPGDGPPWTAETLEPPARGNSSDWGYDAKSIAIFTSYPHDTYESGTIRFGVAAFHINGIREVRFGLNQPGQNANDLDAWVSVTEMSLNPDTNVMEYFVELDIDQLVQLVGDPDLVDGKYELRALAIPEIGESRLLSWDHRFQTGQREYNWPFHLNPGGSLPHAETTISSGQSIAAAAQSVGEGGTVYLRAGQYSWGNLGVSTPNERFLTIEAAPGVNRESVIINSGGGSTSGINGFLKVKNIRIERTRMGGGTSGFGPNAAWVFDGIHFIGEGRGGQRHGFFKGCGTGEINPASNYYGKGCLFRGIWVVGNPQYRAQFDNSNEPFRSLSFVRGATFTNLGNDLFKAQTNGAIDIEVFGWGSAGQHTDIWQCNYALCTESNGSFGPCNDGEPPAYDNLGNMIGIDDEVMDNVLFYNLRLVSDYQNTQAIYVTHDGAAWDNVAFVNMSFWRTPGSNGAPGQWPKRSNHVLLLNNTIYGGNQSFGNNSWSTPGITNALIKGNFFNRFSLNGGVEAVFEDNHFFIAPGWVYTGAGDLRTTNGGNAEAMFVDPNNYGPITNSVASFANPDMRPRSGSILEANGVPGRLPRLVSGDVENNPRAETTAVGAHAGMSE